MSFRDSLGMSLRGAYLTMHRTFQAHFAPFGVTADQFVVLTLLAEEEGIIQKELVARTFSDPNTITAILRLLEQQKLVRRVRHDEDGRARRVYLTDRGRKLQHELAEQSAALHRRLRDSVPAEEREAFGRSLQAVAQAMRPRRPAIEPS